MFPQHTARPVLEVLTPPPFSARTSTATLYFDCVVRDLDHTGSKFAALWREILSLYFTRKKASLVSTAKGSVEGKCDHNGCALGSNSPSLSPFVRPWRFPPKTCANHTVTGSPLSLACVLSKRAGDSRLQTAAGSVCGEVQEAASAGT